jgi:hypothetical protein
MIRRRYPVDRVHSLSPAPVQSQFGFEPQEPTGCPAFSNAGLACVRLYLLVSAPLQSRLGLGFLHRLIWRDAGLGGVRCDELAIARRFTAGAWPGPFLAFVLSS